MPGAKTVRFATSPYFVGRSGENGTREGTVAFSAPFGLEKGRFVPLALTALKTIDSLEHPVDVGSLIEEMRVDSK
jgi:hypothetical protein